MSAYAGRAIVDLALERRLRRGLRAGQRALVLLTAEDQRALAVGERLGEVLDWPVHTWSAASGVDGSGREAELSGLLARLLDGVGVGVGVDAEGGADSLWLLFDAGEALRGAADLRRVRELAQRSAGPTLIFVEREPGRLAALPELGVERLALPDADQLGERLAWIAGQLPEEHAELSACLRANEAALARAGVGLELARFDRLIAEAALACPPQAAALLEFIARHKPDALAHDGLLEPTHSVPAAELGGLDRYRSWLARRALALAPAARDAGIPAPRGVLLVGVQGCGKSLAARASADLLGLALVRLDLGRLFGGTVGESEANLRRVTATVERMAPVVLWVDEIDKGLAGVEGGRSDAGTAARVVGALLTWLQEREQAVFVVATANRVAGLPPELLRRGRLDELFFVDLPDADQRAQILAIHLEAKAMRELGVAPPLADPRARYLELARAADGYSGAELEAALIEARLAAFARGEPLAAADLEAALAEAVPLSRSHAEAIASLRAWAEGRARLA